MTNSSSPKTAISYLAFLYASPSLTYYTDDLTSSVREKMNAAESY